MDLFVEEGRVEQAVAPVEDKVFDEEANHDLRGEYREGGETGHGVWAAEEVEERVGGEDDGKNEEEVVEEDTGDAATELRGSGGLLGLEPVAVQGRDKVEEEER